MKEQFGRIAQMHTDSEDASFAFAMNDGSILIIAMNRVTSTVLARSYASLQEAKEHELAIKEREN